MREWLQRFMTGRYGADAFGRFLNVVVMIFLVLSLLGIPLALVFALGLMVYSYVRVFSRNLSKRGEENAFYLREKARVTRWFRTRRQRLTHLREYRYFRCPSCGQDVRVPRGQGEIRIRCPKCRTEFEKKS